MFGQIVTRCPGQAVHRLVCSVVGWDCKQSSMTDGSLAVFYGLLGLMTKFPIQVWPTQCSANVQDHAVVCTARWGGWLGSLVGQGLDCTPQLSRDTILAPY